MSHDLAGDLTSAVRSVTRDWKKAKRRADREDRVTRRDLERLRSGRRYRETIRDVAFRVMEEAYLKASGGGRYPANARQVYYAARPAILAEAQVETVDSQYFTQVILKDYLEHEQPAWDVVYDARGHLAEPHTGTEFGLGGIEVRNYVAGFRDQSPEFEAPAAEPLVPASGPALRYSAVLFVEKEGFGPLLEAAQIAERFDLAIASTKGMPVSAFCNLLHHLDRYGCTVYVAHDFDKAGFSIVGALKRGTRGSQGTGTVADLGLRLADIEGLERERVMYGQHVSPKWNLRENGATAEEVQVLVQGGTRGWWGERVELNAMPADQFVAWLERQLAAHGVRKVIPDEGVLASAYRRAAFLQALEAASARIKREIEKEHVVVPCDLGQRVKDMLGKEPSCSWDLAVWKVAEARSAAARKVSREQQRSD